MVLWKAWFDIRKRFYISFVFFLLIAGLHVAFFPLIKGMGADYQKDFNIQTNLEVTRLMNDYAYYTQRRWFEEVERNAIFAILLALGGVLTEARTRTILLTLSLPVKRRTWLIAQFFIVMALLLAMNIAVLPILAGAAGYFNSTINPFYALLGSMLLVLASAPYVAITILFTSLTNDQLRAAIYSFAFLIFSNQLDRFASVHPWFPEIINESLTVPMIPWQGLITIVGLSIVAMAVAIRRFESADY
jgi:ABC-type transport system involved in multi-copper enzyme maturation permease subunit